MLVGCFVCAADAAPKYTRTPTTSTAPELVEAERLWSVAMSLPDREASEAWEAAALAFAAIAEAGKLTKAEQLEAARAAMLAMKNALSVDPRVKPPSDKADWDRKPTPQPIPPRELRLIRIFEIYRKLDATSDDSIGLLFLHGNVLRRYEHFDEAIAIFIDILDHHRDHETAEYAANLALDSYNRLQKYDELVALADRLRADAAFMAKHEDLAATVRKIHAQSVAHAAERCSERARQSGIRSEREHCADLYVALADEDKASDEALFNAMVALEEAGRLDRVRETARLFEKRHRASVLRPRVLARHAAAEAAVGEFARAAQLGEQMLGSLAGDRAVAELGENVVRWRLLVGDLDRAARDLDAVAVSARGRTLDNVAALQLQLIAARLAAGQRTHALELARTVRHHAWDQLGTSALDVAALLALAACPVELVDGLCLRRRDPDVMRRVRAELDAIVDPDPREVATRMALDFELEAVVAHRRGAREDHVIAGYESLVTSNNLATRTAARARLAQLAAHGKRSADARVAI
ncbi:MAG TPA: hypothetical protein VIV40_23990, partial [Kofleriaceae bacterium]